MSVPSTMIRLSAQSPCVARLPARSSTHLTAVKAHPQPLQQTVPRTRAHPGALQRADAAQPRSVVVARSAAVEGEGVVDTRTIREITKDDYASCLEEAGERLVVVDFYTTWCGPCKAMMPKLLDMQDEMSGVTFLKFNCNKYNKELGQALGIKVAPTFHLYKKSQKVAEMTGAKVEELRGLIEKHA